ncbi:MAG: hypothetical protein V1707_02785 [bacterium]
MEFILGLIAVIIGFLIIWKTEWMLQNFGRIEWAERHLGTEGGSRLFYKLLALVIIFFGLTAMTGLYGNVMRFLLSPLINLGR